jgi:hypothetical protein
MIEFLTAAPNLPFSVAIAIMLLLALIEVIGLLLGSGVLGAFSAGADADLDLDTPDLSVASLGDRLLGWLHVGQVPVLVLIVLFLTAFGLFGLGLQSLSVGLTGVYLHLWLAIPLAVLLSMPVVRLGGTVVARLLPRDETSVVSRDALLGRVAVIVLGTAEVGLPAQARVRDQHGLSHYLMVEPENPGDRFESGSEVLLMSRDGARYRGVRNTAEAVQDWSQA